MEAFELPMRISLLTTRAILTEVWTTEITTQEQKLPSWINDMTRYFENDVISS